MRNFNNPYFSRDIAEFWRRWHISLTTWFRDYVYIPLGGSRVGKWKIVRNTFVIFLLSGFWHGANWTFIAWGAYHALLFLPLILLGMNRKYTNQVAEGRWLPTIKETGQILLTFMLVVFGWIILRATGVPSFHHYMKCMFSIDTLSFVYEMFIQADVRRCIELCIFMLVIEWIQRDKPHSLCMKEKTPMYVQLLVCLIVALLTYFLSPSTIGTFIYFQF